MVPHLRTPPRLAPGRLGPSAPSDPMMGMGKVCFPDGAGSPQAPHPGGSVAQLGCEEEAGTERGAVGASILQPDFRGDPLDSRQEPAPVAPVAKRTFVKRFRPSGPPRLALDGLLGQRGLRLPVSRREQPSPNRDSRLDASLGITCDARAHSPEDQ